MKRYKIFRHGSVGNTRHVVSPVKDQPDDGFENYDYAEEYLLAHIEDRKGYGYDRPWFDYFILPVYSSKDARF